MRIKLITIRAFGAPARYDQGSYAGHPSDSAYRNDPRAAVRGVWMASQSRNCGRRCRQKDLVSAARHPQYPVAARPHRPLHRPAARERSFLDRLAENARLRCHPDSVPSADDGGALRAFQTEASSRARWRLHICPSRGDLDPLFVDRVGYWGGIGGEAIGRDAKGRYITRAFSGPQKAARR